MFPPRLPCDVQDVGTPDPDALLRDLGRRIAEVRGKAGLTQEQLAERLGLTPRYIQMIEAGDANPPVRSLAELAQALDVELRQLFEEPASREVRVGRTPGRGEPRS